MQLVEIRIFPVKSLRGDLHEAAMVEPRGLAGDRRWMVVNEAGRLQTQRDFPHMALLAARNGPDGVTLAAPGLPPLQVKWPAPAAETLQVSVWDDMSPALAAGAQADAWLHQALGAPCRLVFQADPAARPVRPEYAVPGDVVSFADGFPVLLASAGSLAALNARLETPVTMLRFRPNLVIAGAAPWAEYAWRRVRIGAALFRVAKPCDRCIVTTIDPETGERPQPEEPLRTLKQFPRDVRGRVLFGQNLVPEHCAELRVGDPVEVLSS